MILQWKSYRWVLMLGLQHGSEVSQEHLVTLGTIEHKHHGVLNFQKRWTFKWFLAMLCSILNSSHHHNTWSGISYFQTQDHTMVPFHVAWRDNNSSGFREWNRKKDKWISKSPEEHKTNERFFSLCQHFQKKTFKPLWPTFSYNIIITYRCVQIS